MKYRRPESGIDPPESDLPPMATDLQSLKALPDPTRKKAGKEVRTDFESVRHAVEADLRRIQHRSMTDWLVDVLTPCLIFAMVLAWIQFLLDVRYVYTDSFHTNLKWTALFFVIGIVALNRLIARDGKDESIMYIFFFGSVSILYTLSMTSMYGSGSMAPGFLEGDWWAVLFNLSIVLFIWWFTNRLVHECCVDTNPWAGDIGILTGTARRIRAAVAARPEAKRLREKEKREGIILRNELEAVDPSAWKKPPPKAKYKLGPATERLPKRHPGISIFYFSVPVLFVFAIGQRVLLRGGGYLVLRGHLYVCAYTVSALMLLMLTSLGGLREYFRARRIHVPAGIGPFWIGLGTTMIVAVFLGAAALPPPDTPEPAKNIEHEYDPWSRNYEFRLVEVEATPDEVIRQNAFVWWTGRIVVGVLGLFVAYGLLRTTGALLITLVQQGRWLPRWMVRLFEFIDRTLQGVTSLPSFPKREKRIRISRDVAICTRYGNPLADPERAAKVTPAEVVEAAYQALCALAYDLGVPRRDGQTPYEFIEAFPKQLKSLREEAVDLTDLYVVSAYSPKKVTQRDLDRVRKFWRVYDRARNRVLR
ncbi:MAG TPA: DUF4129 domain-containing protein [Candidatus Hydrogenedentes bacterium]|nr:DUF4129 domain-containing protein [Candidatus Hydrogenedentota bacterium]